VTIFPRRIISLVPSITETLAELGVGERVVGRTRYCVHPRPWVNGLPAVGGTKNPDPRAVAALRPDLIVVNREENRPAQFPELAAIAPLHETYPRDVDGALQEIEGLARRVGAAAEGEALIARIAAERARARAAAAGRAPFTYAYMIWRRPWMSVNADTYVHALLAEIGGVNVLGARAERYPEVSAAELLAASPQHVLLSSEPYDFRLAHAAELPGLESRCRLVDGELLSWHGSRMELAFPYLRELALALRTPSP
jgi:ABC-type Fe3+-hydroxamate transport system substrate-binding protein